MFTMLSKQIPYKYHIYAQCILEERTINLIFSVKCYHVKHTDLVKSYSWTHLVHGAVKCHVLHRLIK